MSQPSNHTEPKKKSPPKDHTISDCFCKLMEFKHSWMKFLNIKSCLIYSFYKHINYYYYY